MNLTTLFKILILVILVTLSPISLADKFDYELVVKQFHNFGFQSSQDSRGRVDYNNRPVQLGYNSKIAIPNDNIFTVSSEGNYQVVEHKDVFSLKYNIGPILADNRPKELYQCYTNLEAKNIDDRYFIFPRFDFTPVNSAGIVQAGTYKLNPNSYQIIPGDAIVTNIKRSQVTNLQLFTITNDIKTEINSDNIDPNTAFKTCIILSYGLLANNIGESIDISLNTANESGTIEASNVIRRSVFGNSDIPKIELQSENIRINNLKSPPSTTNTNSKKNEFGLIQVLAFSPALIILILIIRYKLKSRIK